MEAVYHSLSWDVWEVESPLDSVLKELVAVWEQICEASHSVYLCHMVRRLVAADPCVHETEQLDSEHEAGDYMQAPDGNGPEEGRADAMDRIDAAVVPGVADKGSTQGLCLVVVFRTGLDETFGGVWRVVALLSMKVLVTTWSLQIPAD